MSDGERMRLAAVLFFASPLAAAAITMTAASMRTRGVPASAVEIVTVLNAFLAAGGAAYGMTLLRRPVWVRAVLAAAAAIVAPVLYVGAAIGILLADLLLRTGD